MAEETGKNTQSQAAADYEYNTLMRLLRVSVSKHLLDEHFTLVWANDFYYELIGWPREEYEARFHNRPDLYYADYPEEWDQLSKTVLETLSNNQSGYFLTTTMPQRGGRHVWVQICNSFANEYVNGFQVSYTVMTNIDDLVRIQKEQSVTYDNLPGFVAKFRVTGDELCFLEANNRFREYFDCPRDEGPRYGLSNIDTERNRAAYAQFHPRMQKGEPVHFTLQAKSRTGGDMWLQVNADCIDWVNAEPVYLVIYIDVTDITEQRELQRQLEERSALLRDALEAAEKANRSKSEFLSRMSHDIRTPMNAIMGMTAIAGAHLDNRERVEDCLAKIDVSAKLLLNLINEVLDMSKIESGRLSMAEEEFSLSEVLQSIVTITQPSIAEKHHTFDIHVYGLRHERVVGDPQRLEQVFLNLLSNAVKYTPEQGRLLLEIRELPSEQEGCGYYEFVFRDNGYGMKPEFLEKIFDPFERADDATVYTIQGTGLGMSISRDIVRRMGGDIRVESAYGKGSMFTVTIYLKLQPEEPAALGLEGLSPVLVVDDDRIACETTCGRLEELGLTGRWVQSGGEAVELAAAAHRAGEDYSVIILDLKMPGMDGIETARRIRREVGTEVPILLLSAYDWTEYEAAAQGAGINGYVVKPMLRSSLLAALKRYVLKEDAAGPAVPVRRVFAGRRLLLVEDNELNREIATEILSQTQADVETAVNGQEAVERFSASPAGYYQLIFMDLQMPVLGGLDAARAIRALDRPDARTVPIVAMTANVFAEDVAAVKAAGMNAHLAKPLDIEQIDRTLEKYLSR